MIETHAGTSPGAVIRAGAVLGIGMGGFVDGIVFHQILQTHSMLSAQRPPTTVVNIEINMVWDGLFHVFTWVMTLAGLVMLFRAASVSGRWWNGRVLAGSMLFGWGSFNVCEGVLNHHVLHLHHVVERHGVSVFDWAFLAFGASLIIGGWMIVRSGLNVRAGGPDGVTGSR